MAKDLELFASIGCANVLGEGVVWENLDQAAIWTDIEGKLICRSVFPFIDIETYPLPERLGSFALIDNECKCFVGAFENGFGRFSLPDVKIDWLCRPPLPANARFNDGRVDRSGRFLAGTMIENKDKEGSSDAALYKLAATSAERVLSGMHISNSLCWSPDGGTMYFADTPRRVIWAYDYVEGHPINQRVFAETDNGAYPDGSVVDAEGYLWNAQWGASRVVRYAPGGQVDTILPIPAPHVTCIAFGGPSLQHLIVTTARAGLSKAKLETYPNSGDVFVFEGRYRGLPEDRMTS